jgi:hypothetical protein
MESSQQAARAWRNIGKIRAAIVLVLASASALSGCYYRGRPPERGGRGYAEHDRGRGWHDRDRR